MIEGVEFPAGWDAERVKRLIGHYEGLSEDEQVAEDEAAAGYLWVASLHRGYPRGQPLGRRNPAGNSARTPGRRVRLRRAALSEGSRWSNHRSGGNGIFEGCK